MKRLVFLVNDAEFFASHRINLAIAAKQQGYLPVVACPPDAEWVPFIEGKGIPVVVTAAARTGGVVAALRLAASYWRVITRIGPDLVHLITSKPIILGGLIARIKNIPVIAAVSGLGYIFTSTDPFVRLLQPVVALGYRMALNRPDGWVIFQNPTDQGLFGRLGITRRAHVALFHGSGVDLEAIRPQPEPSGPIVVLLPARILRDKGVIEFAEAAARLKPKYGDAIFRIQGKFDTSNPSTLRVEEMQPWIGRGEIEIAPHASDVNAMLAAAHIVVLPSYREGFPKSLVDAAAAGRASITTDVPGCRDAVIDQQTGLIVPARDPVALERAIVALLDNAERRQTMGKKARLHAEAQFGTAKITDQHLQLYAAALNDDR